MWVSQGLRLVNHISNNPPRRRNNIRHNFLFSLSSVISNLGSFCKFTSPDVSRCRLQKGSQVGVTGFRHKTAKMSMLKIDWKGFMKNKHKVGIVTQQLEFCQHRKTILELKSVLVSPLLSYLRLKSSS